MAEKRRFVSLAVKNSVVYIFLILASSSMIGYVLYRISSDVVISGSQQQLTHTLEILDVKINSYIENIRKDILYLSRSPYLEDYIREIHTAHPPMRRNVLAEDYISFMSTKPDYAQLRVIGKANAGQEIIRVERTGRGMNLVQKDQLQQKGIYSYFRETLEYPEDSVYFSVIDLNKEFGKISMPEMTTLRAACPIYLADTVFGIIIINANLNAFIDEIRKTVPRDFNLFLINNDGYYLLHPDPKKQFGFEKQQPATAFAELNIEPAKLGDYGRTDTKTIDDRFLLAYKKVHYPRQNYFLVLGLQASREDLLSYFYRWQGSIILVTLGIVFLAVLVALAWLSRQTNSLKSITNSLVSFEQNLEAENLPIHLNDEIGLLARSFSSMADTIKSNFTKLELARQEAVHANEQKEEFLQNMSHEIRNPLHTIIGMCRVLSDNNPRKDQLSLIDSLKFSSEHLLALVNDVLDFAKLKEGRISLVCEPVPVSTLLNQIMKSYLYESKTRKLDFDLELDPRLQNLVVLTDPVRINQILHNLLSNAFKFTREGGKVRLVVRLEDDSEKQVRIHFEVKDTGIGIESENLDLIRQRFAKVDRSDSPVSNIQGAGLGLPIVIQLLDLFDSSLEISSQAGQGSVFSFDLVLGRTTEDLGTRTVSRERSRERFEGLEVLIVDDDPQILDLYRHVLAERLSNFETLSHPSRLAVELAGRKFDLIITDFNFDEEQITAYSHLINQRLKAGARLVCITGAHDVAVIRDNELLKIDEVWQKPVKPERLLDLLRTMTREDSHPLPDFSALYEDYDQDRGKVSNALGIMLDEWQAAVTGFELAVQEKSAVKMKAVLHRLANTLRRIKLDYLEKDLEQLVSSDPFGADEVNSTWAGIKSKMLFYLDCIRQELEKCNSL